MPSTGNDFVIGFKLPRVEPVALIHYKRQVSKLSGKLETPIVFPFKGGKSEGERGKAWSIVTRKGPPCFQE